MPDAEKRKIAVLGGGVGSLTTVCLLTNEPGWQDRYEITVYQMGWRLGGKGACGRNPRFADRIEEHGPHVWFGFYQAAFEMLNTCYEYCRAHDLTPDSPFQKCIPDAMKAKNDSTVMEFVNGQWKPWHVTLPVHSGSPVDPPAGLIAQMVSAVEWLVGIHDGIRAKTGGQAKTLAQASFGARELEKAYRLALAPVLPGGEAELAAAAGKSILEEVARILRHVAVLHPQGHVTVERIAGRAISSLLRAFMELLDAEVHPFMTDDEIRRAWMILDLGLANLCGVFDDDILFRGFESINGQDYSDWLAKHGCRVPWSPIVQGLYDTCFAFQNGATGDPNSTQKPKSASMEAGSTLRGALLLFFGYNGSYCYKMQSGMGDTIFTPLYLTLRHRGVKFKFFHQVTNLCVEDSLIESIDLNVQATVAGGSDYQPLKPVKGLYCWPNQPFFEQLVEGGDLRRQGVNLESVWSGWQGSAVTLRRGEDFDQVVLGISLGLLPAICRELTSQSQAWRDMIANLQTVQTQSFQIWLTRTAKELGWPVDTAESLSPAERQFELMAGYTQPIDSWADMSQVLPTEAWGDAVKSVHYIFGPLEDAASIPAPWTRSDFPEVQSERVKDQMREFLSNNVAPLFPLGVNPSDANALDWNLLADPSDARGVERLNSQYWRANVEPSERYVLSLQGTARHRLDPGNSGFGNLFLAGDWTHNGFDVGCVEAAALSAKLAAAAVARSGAQPGGKGD